MDNLPATNGLDDSKIDIVCQMITEGRTYRDIANHFEVTLWCLFKYLYDDKHSVRTREAREFSAHVLVDQAELVLAQAKDNPQYNFIAAQLAHHYRWKAALLNKRQYGKDAKPEIEDQGKKREIIIKVIEE